MAIDAESSMLRVDGEAGEKIEYSGVDGGHRTAVPLRLYVSWRSCSWECVKHEHTEISQRPVRHAGG